MNSRTLAANTINQVIYQGKSLTDVLNKQLTIVDTTLSSQEKAWIKNSCFGSLRWHYQLTALLALLINKPIKAKDKDIECLIRIGLYQIMYQDTPDHAAVNETVIAAKALNKKWAKGFINGVLRRFLRNQAVLQQQCRRTDSSRYAYPEWLLAHLQQAWPENWRDMVIASNERAPMTLRVNLQQQTRHDYLTRLQQAGLSAYEHPLVDTALVLEQPVNVRQLPDFFTGACSVQDASAQLAAQLLQCKPNMSVLDACAAPGGKTGHIAELTTSLTITALDNSARRLVRVQENLVRLGYLNSLNNLNSDEDQQPMTITSLVANHTISLIVADANQPSAWYNDAPYDRILLDAPCSATGVIRRHPDIKLLRKQQDIATLVQQQRHLLATLWPLLQAGGKLLYATCSILPEENDHQIAHFLTRHSDAVVVPCAISDTLWGAQQQYGRQIFSGAANMDGFYYALLEKR